MADQQKLKRICGRFRMRLRALLIQYGTMRTIFFVLGLAAVLMGCDWYFRFSPDGRLMSLLGLISVAGLCYYFDFHRPLRRFWSDNDVLGYIDRVSGNGDDALTTLRDFQQPEGMREYDTEQGKQIVHAVVADLEQRIEQLDVGRLIQGRPVNRWRAIAFGLLAAYGVSLVLLRAPSGEPYVLIGLQRIFMPNALIYWPQKTRIIVKDPESGWRVPRGEALVVNAEVEGEVPAVVDIWYKNESSDLWISERTNLNPETKQAMFTFGEMMEPLQFYLIGGDDKEQRTFNVTVADRPIITAIKAHYKFPEYTKLGEKISATGQLSGISGTDVTLEVKASSSLTKASILFELDGEEPKPVVIADLSGDTFKHNFRLGKSGRYTVELVDGEGLKNGKPERYEIRVEPDKIPEVTLDEPKGDLIMTSRGWVRIKFKAKDDYDLKELSVMLAPEGGKGEPLSDRITGPFWNPAAAVHPVGEGDFILDFLKERDKSTLQKWKIQSGAQLELWVHAVDCNPYEPGIAPPIKIRISLMQETDFMDDVVLKTKELMNDTRTGWFAAAGTYHDGTKWLKNTSDENLLDTVSEQKETANNAIMALKIRFPEIIEHMQRNRMKDEFMARRLDAIGGKIHELDELLPKIAKQFADGRPSSAEEAQGAAKLAKMAKAVSAALPNVNTAAWRYRLLYNRLADWVSLQSILLKTRRIEEHQREVNKSNAILAAKILGREKEELEDEEVRDMKEVTNRQQTIFEMTEAVEKELAEQILQADKDGRKKIWEFLGKAFQELQSNQVRDKLKRAAMAIGDARGDTVKRDLEEALKTIAILNLGLIKAGEEVPEDPPIPGTIEDPRGKTVEDKKPAEQGEQIDPEAYKNLEKLRNIEIAKKDSLEATLDEIFSMQETARNRTMHVQDRIERNEVSKRYLRLRTWLFEQQQGEINKRLAKAKEQVKEYGKREPKKDEPKDTPEEAKKKEDENWEDPTLDVARKHLDAQVGELLAGAEYAKRMLHGAAFDPFVSGIQDHIHRGVQDLRVYIQGREEMYKLLHARKQKNFVDDFDRKFLLNAENLIAMVDSGHNLEWALALQGAVQRQAEILNRFGTKVKSPSKDAQQSATRIHATGQGQGAEVFKIVKEVQQAVAQKIKDPQEKDRENEVVKPTLIKNISDQFQLADFESALKDFDGKSYSQAALKQESLRRAISGTLVNLKDLFEARVPEKAPPPPDETGPVEIHVEGLEYNDEKPPILADRLEKDGDWIDKAVGNAEVRQSLVKRLKDMQKFDPRYARLQSAYFQAVAQNFQSTADKKKKKEEKPAEKAVEK